MKVNEYVYIFSQSDLQDKLLLYCKMKKVRQKKMIKEKGCICVYMCFIYINKTHTYILSNIRIISQNFKNDM